MIAALVSIIYGCSKEGTEPVQFKLSAKQNQHLTDDIDFHRLENNVWIARVPLDIDLDSLIVEWDHVDDDAVVSIGDETQEFGTTANDFSSPKEYLIVDDLDTESYKLCVFHNTGIPIMYLQLFDTETESITRESYNSCNTVLVDEIGGDVLITDLEVRGRGNSTWNPPKKPFQIKFDKSTSVLGMPAAKKWVLLAEYIDKTMLRNRTAFALGQLSRLDWTPQGRFVDLVINGDYRGTYHLVEKVEVDENRVNLSDDGYLLEVDKLGRLDDDDIHIETDTFLFNIKAPKVDWFDDQYTYINDFINAAEDTLRWGDYKDSLTGYHQYFDMDSFIDWYIINEITKNTDAQFHSSVYMTLEPGEKLKMGPLWDFDIAFGNVDFNQNWDPEGFWIMKSVWIKKLMYDDNFKNAVRDRWKFFYDSKETIYEEIRNSAAILSKSQQLNDERWDLIGTDIWPNYVVYDTYEEEVEALINWLELRCNWIDQNL